MTTKSITPYPTTSAWSRPRIIKWTALTIAMLLIVAALSFLFSPAGVRWMADQTAQAPAVGITQIEIQADAELNHVFAPAVTQIESGQTVTWHFNEVDEDGFPVAHNVVFDDLASLVQSEGTFSRMFDTPGTYEYTCTLHAFMDGVVVVAEAQ